MSKDKSILTLLFENKKLHSDLDRLCDFYVISPDDEGYPWVDKDTASSVNFIAHTASGCYYGLLENGHVVFISPEGLAGTMTTSLEKALGLLIALSGVGFWLEIMSWYKTYSLDEMRNAIYNLGDNELSDDESEEDIIQKRIEITKQLGIETVLDPAEIIYNTIHATEQFSPKTPDNEDYFPLLHEY